MVNKHKLLTDKNFISNLEEVFKVDGFLYDKNNSFEVILYVLNTLKEINEIKYGWLLEAYIKKNSVQAKNFYFLGGIGYLIYLMKKNGASINRTSKAFHKWTGVSEKTIRNHYYKFKEAEEDFCNGDLKFPKNLKYSLSMDIMRTCISTPTKDGMILNPFTWKGTIPRDFPPDYPDVKRALGKSITPKSRQNEIT